MFQHYGEHPRVEPTTSDSMASHQRVSILVWTPPTASSLNGLLINSPRVAYVAFPLALHVLNTHLSTSDRQASSSGTLIEVMMTMHNQYDGVHWVAKLVRYLVELVQNDSRLSAGRKAASWAELLTFKPRTYLRLALAMDLSMSSGRIPDHEGFAAQLEAKVMRTLAGSERTHRIHDIRLTSSRDETTAPTDDLMLSADFFEMDSRALEAHERHDSMSSEGDTGGSFADVTGEGEQDAATQPCATDMDFDGLTSLSADMESFFDPELGDLAGHPAEDVARDFGSDHEVAMLAT